MNLDWHTAIHGAGAAPDVRLDVERLWQSDPETWVADYEAWHVRQPGNRGRGAYYTPRPVAAYLASRTLGRRLDEAAVRIRTCPDPESARAVWQTIRAWRLADPACGSGVFLLEALLALHAFYAATAHIVPPPPAGEILEQLHGMEIDPLAAAVCRARLHQWACRLECRDPARTPMPQASPIRCGDTLAPSSGLGDRWDFILGNPPYVSEVRGGRERFRALAEQHGYYRAKMDLCDAFLAWSLEALAPGGELAFVLPEYWLQRSSTAPLRQRLLAMGQMVESWHYGESTLFAAAPGHHSHLLVWRKTGAPHPPDGQVMIGAGDARPPDAGRLQTGRLALHPLSLKLLIGSPEAVSLLVRLAEAPPLLQPGQIQQGLVLPQGRLKARDRARLDRLSPQRPCPDAGFLLTDAEAESLNLSDTEAVWLRPFHTPAGFQPFSGFGRPPDYRLIYADATFRRELNNRPEAFGRLKTHLESFAPVNTAAFAPYGLHRPRRSEWFESPHKILCPRQVSAPAFAPVEAPAYVGEGFYLLLPAEADRFATAALLNSTLAWFWFYHHKRKGHRLQIDKDVLSAFPAPPRPDPALWSALDELARRWTSRLQTELDRLVATLYGLDGTERAMLCQWRDALTGRAPGATMESEGDPHADR